MTADISLRARSLQLYSFMCQHIVGTEETVRTKRLIQTIWDTLNVDETTAQVTSGSIGEGLELKGSDIDMMLVWKFVILYKDTDDVKYDDLEKMILVIEMNDAKPGFTLLRSPFIDDRAYIFLQRGNSWYLSSERFKLVKCQATTKIGLNIIHGPCLSNKTETADLAYCPHYPHWIQPAENWLHRGHIWWPSSDVMSDVIDHGVLFVPIGSKGSVNEALEWRISFSIAEKLLIYSFSHTQLLCYALMKILLKDLINSNINCKNLLCSYFIKTIIFWVSEETSVTEWKPENLIQCFMRCFRRLLYCVEYSMCPHYFIPIINLFEYKIEGQPRQLLLGHLNILFSFGWRCVLFSEHFQNFTIHSNTFPSTLEIKRKQLGLILTSFASRCRKVIPNKMSLNFMKCIRILRNNKSSVIKLTCMRFISIICSSIQQSIPTSFDRNKKNYSQHRIQLAYLLQNIHHDAVSGWLMLAAFFYRAKQYRDALCILFYTIRKCTPEKVYYQKHLTQLQLNMTTSTTLKRLGIVRVLKLVTVNNIEFEQGSTLLPEELTTNSECSFPPVVFAQFLCSLCHYHLNDIQQCYNSIRDIQLTIDEHHFIRDPGIGYMLLGWASLLTRQTNLTIPALTNALNCKTFTTDKKMASKLLSIINMLEIMNEFSNDVV